MELEASITLPSIDGFTAILPSVSVGNVGQLAVDILLATLKPMLITQVHHPLLIPCCGADPLNLKDSDLLTTAMQLYIDETSKLAIFQIRSGILPGHGSTFLDDFLNWCNSHGIKRIVCLASSHSHERSDVQIASSPLRYIATTSLTKTNPPPETFVRLELKKQFPELQSDNDLGIISIPGGGIATRFFESCEEKCLQGIVLLKFCAEGDNTEDAIQVADYLQQYLPWKPPSQKQYSVPPSWKHLFGPPLPQEMFW